MHNQTRRCTVAMMALALGALPYAAQQDYAIKLHRASVVGQKYVLVASASEDQNMTASIDGQPGPAQSESTAAELTAHVTTLAVTAAGKESKISLVIDKSKCMANGITSELLPAGTTVIASREQEGPMYSVNDTPVNARAAQCLKMLVSLGTEGAGNDDKIFGTTSRQKVGGSWPLNSTLAAQELFSASGLTVDAKNLSGSTRLAEATTFNEQPALRIVGEMKMTNVQVPLPPGVNVTSSEFNVTLSGVLPVDATRTDGQFSMTMNGRVECEGDANGHKMRLLVLSSQKEEHTITLAPATPPGR